MSELNIIGTAKTPTIQFANGHIVIKGKSIPEDPKKCFKPALSFFEDIKNYEADAYDMEIRFEYCDSGSLKWVLNIMLEIQKKVKNKPLVINWCYEYDDYEMLELGEFVRARIKCPFNLVELDV